jgi:hypothetical protein
MCYLRNYPNVFFLPRAKLNNKRLRKKVMFLVLLALLLVATTSAWGNCPEDSSDRGNCDTLYVEPWTKDTLQSGMAPYLVRVPIYITVDVADRCDSIAAFAIPLCYTHTNPVKYCSLTYYWNNYTNFTNPHSIFRHLVSDGDTIHNWMMDQWENGNGGEWNFISLQLASDSAKYATGQPPPLDSVMVPPHYVLVMASLGMEDHWFESGSRILLATITFKVQDTMQICIDTCFWPPSTRLASVTAASIGGQCIYGIKKIPRMGTPHDPLSYQVCFDLHHTDFLCGDVNADGTTDVGDVVYLINYLFKNGTAPNPIQSGDVNGDANVDVGDIVNLINYLFKGGPAPSC